MAIEPTYHVFKETAVPAEIAPNAVYLVAPPGKPGVLEIYVSDAAGTALRKAIDAATVQQMIDNTISAGDGGTVIVDDLDARALLSPANGMTVLVIDASDDPTVEAGAATYIWRESTSAWIKISEAESMDVALTWAALTGRPAAPVADIDDAVTKRHSHANKTQLDKLGEDANGNLTYGGVRPGIAWNSTNW